MGGIANEPSMEEILSSIKRIIAEEGDQPLSASRSRSPSRKPKVDLSAPAADADEVLELTDPVGDPEDASAAAAEQADLAQLVSSDAAIASREKLASLSALIIRPEAGENTLEGLVREMLRPMLKEWLDANLPTLVERIVAREVARITGQGG